MNLLLLSYHDGCAANLEYVANVLGHELTTQRASWNYNIGHNRASEIWETNKHYYSQFDCIITSDTAPLCRIFLQANFSGKLIIWCCNRVDYADQASNDCGFPDQEYYQLLNSIPSRPNVKIFSYTKFEHEYAARKGVHWAGNLLKPITAPIESTGQTLFPPEINKSETFFIPPYHNDTIFMNLKSKCESLDIKTYAGRYSGAQDLKGVKGIIHIPYAWCNLAMFENWSLGNVYFVPSKQFFLQLINQPNFWFQDTNYKDLLDSSEWYLPEHRDLFMYFDSWEHLKEIVNYDLTGKKKLILEFSQQHHQKTLTTWKEAIEQWG